MTKLLGFLIAGVIAGCAALPCEADSPQSSWVYYGADGTLQYRATASGDTIPDFSSVGYMQGKQLIPTVAVKETLAPDGAADDTARIQAAIDAVSAMPLDSNGFRGAVLLTAGTFNIAGQLRISASGVVIRGTGQGPTGTELYDVGTTMRDLILAQPSTDYQYREVSGTRQQVTDTYVPVGATSFDVASTAGYHVGDKIIVNRPSTAAWITAIGMDASQMGTEAWTPSSSFIQQDRTITAINGNRITIDIPIGTSMDQNNGFGGGSIFKYTAGRISNVGVEDIRFDSHYVSDRGRQPRRTPGHFRRRDQRLDSRNHFAALPERSDHGHVERIHHRRRHRFP